MEKTTLTDFKERLRAQGFEQKALVSDEEMELAIRAVEAEEGILDTPARYSQYFPLKRLIPPILRKKFLLLPLSLDIERF